MSFSGDKTIRCKADLVAACAQVRAEGVLSLDTEFVWRRTYRPQLGIVQMGCRSDAWVVDCTCAFDPVPLAELIADSSVVKILHDARQDLTHLHHWTGTFPRNVFDTQLAACFAGFPHGYGLQKLLFEAVNVGLAKTETMTDWLQRPLTPAQVSYALDDVRYLPDLHDELIKRAQAFGTYAWLEEECLTLENPILYVDYDAETLWRRVKLHRKPLNRRGLAVLRALVILREETAKAWNLPRNWLGDDSSLVEAACKGRLGHLVHRLKGGRVDTLRALYAKCIEDALSLPETDLPEPTPVGSYLPEVRDAADHAVSWLATQALTHHVDPQMVASRPTVMRFIDNPYDEACPLSAGWRYEVFGREMIERFGV